MKISVSSVAFRNTSEILSFLESNPDVYLEFGVNLESHDVDALIKEKVKSFSLHIPSPNSGYFPNFAAFSSKIMEESYSILDRSIKTAIATGAKIMVLHAGYADEILLPSLFEEREPYLEQQVESLQKYVLLREGAINNKFYVNSALYNKYLKKVIKALKDVNKYLRERGIVLAVENLNPRILYLFQRPNDFAILVREVPGVHICLDVGHLWISSQINGFNFYEGLEEILSTVRVITCHLHNNRSDRNLGFYADEHGHLRDGKIDMAKILALLGRFKLPNITIEVKGNPAEDVEYVRERI